MENNFYAGDPSTFTSPYINNGQPPQQSSYYPSDPTAGPSITLNSPSYPSTTLPFPTDYAVDPSIYTRPLHGPGSRGGRVFNRGVGRGRGRGGGRGSRGGSRGSRGSGRGRGRGRGGPIPGTGSSRQSTRISQARANQSAAQHNQPKLNLKLSLKSGGLQGESAGGRMMSFLGEYDRELDEDGAEPLAFEEQFILRVPKHVAEGGKGVMGLAEMVKGKGKGLDGVEMKFLDSRRAVFKHGGTSYAAKLVDLPNIIEAQKTVDNRHLFKIADISQMLVVTDPVTNESSITAAPLKVDDYIWPHGITPPMRHVRKRRFRKRLSRRAIENVEEQVEELLKKDEEAEATSYDLIEAHPDPDVDDSYYIGWSAEDPYAAWHGHGEDGSEFGGSEMYEDPGSAIPGAEDWGEEGEEYGTDFGGEGEGGGEDGDLFSEDEDGEAEDDLDQELAAALQDHSESEGSVHSGSEDGISDDDEEDEDDNDKSEDDDETQEKKAKIKQFASEIKQLETAIEKKRAGFTGGNPIMMKRFEETIAGLQAEINTKVIARQALVDDVEKKDLDGKDDGKQGPAGPSAQAEGRGETGISTPMDAEADMDDGEGDAEGEEESAETPAVRMGESPAQYAGEGEEEDDLFGDGEADADGEGEAAEDEDEEGYETGDGEETQTFGQGEEMDEMAAMLMEEMARGDSGDAALDGQGTAEAAAALDDLAFNGGLDGENDSMDFGSLAGLNMSQPGLGGLGIMPVDGGVGRRRLATGVPDDEDGDDDSSDDSDD